MKRASAGTLLFTAVSSIVIMSSTACAPSLALSRRNDFGVRAGGVSDWVEVPPCLPYCASVGTAAAPIITAEYSRTIVQPNDSRLKILAGVLASLAPGVHGFSEASASAHDYSLATVVPVAGFRADFRGMWEFLGGFGAARYSHAVEAPGVENQAASSWWTTAAHVGFNVGYNFSPAFSTVAGAASTWTHVRPTATPPAGSRSRQLVEFHAGVRFHF